MKRQRDSQSRFFTRRDFLKISALSGGAAVLGSLNRLPVSIAKDAYPAEIIKWITPYRVGGGFDLIARGIIPYLTKYLKEFSPTAKGGDIMLRNEVGGEGQRAYYIIYRAKPDGYTIGAFDIAFAIESAMSKLDFDIQKFTYLIRLNTATRLLVTNKNGFASWDEMVKSAKTKELKWGVGVLWRSTHADSIIVKEETGIPARFIPFGNTALTMNAMIRGDIQVALMSEDSVRGLLDAGEIKVLATFTEKSDYPGVPSIKDLGYPHIPEKLGVHRFLIGPPAFPGEIKNIMITTFKKALNDNEFKAWAKKSGFVMNPIYGDEAEKLAKRMIKFYQEDMKPIIKKYRD